MVLYKIQSPPKDFKFKRYGASLFSLIRLEMCPINKSVNEIFYGDTEIGTDGT